MLMMEIGMLIVVGVVGCFFPPIEARLVKQYVEITHPARWRRFGIIMLMEVLAIALIYSYRGIGERVMYLCFMVIAIFLACFDYKYMILPSKIIYFGSGLGILFQMIRSISIHNVSYLMSSILGGVVGCLVFGLIFYGSKWLLKKEGLGFGDVRLMALMGIYIGIEALFLMILIASLLAAIVGSILYVVKRKSEAFPFGPFLCASSLVMVIYGEQIISFYLRCMGFE